jgi:hypothetical protein
MRPTSWRSSASPPGAESAVVVDVEVLGVDPDGASELERHPLHPLAVARDQVHAVEQRPTHLAELRRWPFEDGHGRHVHVRAAVGVFDVQERDVERAQTVHGEAPSVLSRGERRAAPSNLGQDDRFVPRARPCAGGG